MIFKKHRIQKLLSKRSNFLDLCLFGKGKQVCPGAFKGLANISLGPIFPQHARYYYLVFQPFELSPRSFRHVVGSDMFSLCNLFLKQRVDLFRISLFTIGVVESRSTFPLLLFNTWLDLVCRESLLLFLKYPTRF